MPKYKKDATDFSIAISIGANQYRATIPKLLMQRLEEAVEIVGQFTLREGELVMRAEYMVVTVAQLLDKWWGLPAGVTKERVQEMEWDELLNAIRIFEVQDASGRDIVISDYDDTTYDTLHVSFSEEVNK